MSLTFPIRLNWIGHYACFALEHRKFNFPKIYKYEIYVINDIVGIITSYGNIW